MKSYVHARLNKEEQALFERLKALTGASESDLIRRGLKVLLDQQAPSRSALELAGSSAGKFRKGPRDLSTNKRHLEGFGE